MKKFLMAVAALACMGSVALAGPNYPGTIIAHDANLQYTVDTSSYCGLGSGIPDCDCQAADVQIDGSSFQNVRVWKVYAAFMPGSSPRLKGMTFGVNYDPGNLILVGFGNCCGDPNNGAAEFQGPGWPGPNTGTSLVFQFTQTNCLVECYWFAGYSYYGNPNTFCLRDNPDPGLGGMFADDSVPSLLDPIQCYGCIGFDMPGEVCCPHGQLTGACCFGTTCVVTTEQDCVGQGGRYLGDNTNCGPPNPCEPPPPTGACCINNVCYIYTQSDCLANGGEYLGDNTDCGPPDPCQPPNPVEEKTWGQIKANYR